MPSSKLATFALASALALCAAPALAQIYNDDPAVYENQEDIIVTAPGVHGRVIGRSSSTGAPIVEVTDQRIVETGDLNLRSDYDVDVLYRRIDRTVAFACRNLDTRVQPTVDSNRDCIRDARSDAMAQADQLIANARG